MQGTVKKASANKVTFADGSEHTIADGAKWLLHGQPAIAGDLRPGDVVELGSDDPATTVTITRP